MRNDSSRGLKVDAFFNGKESIRAHITSFARSVTAETFPPVTKITMIVRAINGADSLLDLFADLSRNCLAFGWEPFQGPTNAQYKCSINSNVNELSLLTIEQIKFDFDKPRLSVSIEDLSGAFPLPLLYREAHQLPN